MPLHKIEQGPRSDVLLAEDRVRVLDVPIQLGYDERTVWGANQSQDLQVVHVVSRQRKQQADCISCTQVTKFLLCFKNPLVWWRPGENVSCFLLRTSARFEDRAKLPKLLCLPVRIGLGDPNFDNIRNRGELDQALTGF